ncbi:hypothetical protein MMC26_006269 [Xylographa opegraphella]|nr:hypothetical protein [Xylographa opegraphella]
MDAQIESTDPVEQPTHRTDAYATKFVDKTTALQEKAKHKTSGAGGDGKQKAPAGGYDKTPVAKVLPGYTVKFTFHRATNLPMADINTLSSDPYLVASLKTSLPLRHKEDPRISFRTRTLRRNVKPEWNAEWIVANVPGSGFQLKCRLYDEDPSNHDDRLGNVHVHVDRISESWEGIRNQPYNIKKRMGSKRAYLVRGCVSMFNRSVPMSGDVFISIEVLGRIEAESGGRMYTIGPCVWSQHFSPMIGRLAGTKDPTEDVNGNSEKKSESYNFQANQVQLAGPVPEQLYHRYVEFRPFVAGMFTSHSFKGRILNHALHHQHARIYNYDRSTIYGSFPSPSKDMTLKFLELVHYDHGGRIFTYVLSLDGQWRFTETGKEFGIDLLSKHTMHSDVSIYIAFSGEFFIRRLQSHHKDPEEQETHPPTKIGGGPLQEDTPQDPAYYQLVIDNDSGTYRPDAGLLEQLKEFLQRNLPGLKITTLDCTGDKEVMEKMKEEQRSCKKKEGKHTAVVQGDGGSISSSDEEDLDNAVAQNDEAKEKGPTEKLGHAIAAPAEELTTWAQGHKAREQRETEDHTGGAR